MGDRRGRVQLVDLWRISNHRDLTGLGGERSDGRWHTAARGKRIVYLSEHPAVALVETLVNLRGNPALFPENYQILKISVPAGTSVQEVGSVDAAASIRDTQAIGDAWLAGQASAILRVPSNPSPESWNYLLNPLHMDAGQAAIAWARWIAYDRRLFRMRAL